MMLEARLKICVYWLVSVASLLVIFMYPPISYGIFPLGIAGSWLAFLEMKKLRDEIRGTPWKSRKGDG
jgi:hypothetical protein